MPSTLHMNTGSDIIETVTYQATVEGFCKYKQLSIEEAEAAIIHANQIALKARDEFWGKEKNRGARVRPLVTACCGPYGVLLHDGSEYTGGYMKSASTATLLEFHRSNLRLALASGVDIVSFLTIPSLKEAELIIQVLEESPNARAMLSFSCKDTKSTCAGDPIESALRLAVHCHQLLAVGINCTAPGLISGLLQQASSVIQELDIPVLVAPNTGASWDAVKRCYNGDGDASVARHVPEWAELGVRMWGGCCNIFPEQITQLRQAVEAYTSKH